MQCNLLVLQFLYGDISAFTKKPILYWREQNARDVCLGEGASPIRRGILARFRPFALNILQFNSVKNVSMQYLRMH